MTTPADDAPLPASAAPPGSRWRLAVSPCPVCKRRELVLWRVALSPTQAASAECRDCGATVGGTLACPRHAAGNMDRGCGWCEVAFVRAVPGDHWHSEEAECAAPGRDACARAQRGGAT